jgi:hypothetical protein
LYRGSFPFLGIADYMDFLFPIHEARDSRAFGRRNNGKQWARFAMKCGLLLTDAKLWSMINDKVRERAGDLGDLVRDKYGDVQDKYDVATNRLDNARGALRGETDWVTPVASFLGGIGVGVAVGMLVAPVSGEEARAAVSSKVSEMTGGRSRFESTGT